MVARLKKSVATKLKLLAFLGIYSCCACFAYPVEQVEDYAQEESMRNLELRLKSMQRRLEGMAMQTKQQAEACSELAQQVTRLRGMQDMVQLPPATKKSTAYEEVTVSAEVLYQQLLTAVEQKNYTRAEGYAINFIDNFPKDQNIGLVYFWLAEIKMLYSDRLQARRYYEEALQSLHGKASSKSADILLKLAVIAKKEGKSARASQYIQRVLKEYPGSTAAHLARIEQKQLQSE